MSGSLHQKMSYIFLSLPKVFNSLHHWWRNAWLWSIYKEI